MGKGIRHHRNRGRSVSYALLVSGVTDIEIAGFIVAVIATVVGSSRSFGRDRLGRVLGAMVRGRHEAPPRGSERCAVAQALTGRQIPDFVLLVDKWELAHRLDGWALGSRG